MNYNPLVSIIVTTYNRKELLKETIDSILNQTIKDFELIVVDNFSNYDFYEFIKSFNSDCIRPFQNKNNGIIAINRNYGINRAKGEYIAFCDDDDLWFSHKIEKQMNKLLNSNKNMIFSMIKEFGEISIYSNYFGINPLPFKVNTSTKALLMTNCIPFSTVLIERLSLYKIGLFDERKSFVAIEDNELWIRASKKLELEFIPEVLSLHRVHKSGIYINSKSIIEGKKEMWSMHGDSDKSTQKKKNTIKQNVFYFLLRNLFKLIYEKYFFPNISAKDY